MPLGSVFAKALLWIGATTHTSWYLTEQNACFDWCEDNFRFDDHVPPFSVTGFICQPKCYQFIRSTDDKAFVSDNNYIQTTAGESDLDAESPEHVKVSVSPTEHHHTNDEEGQHNRKSEEEEPEVSVLGTEVEYRNDKDGHDVLDQTKPEAEEVVSVSWRITHTAEEIYNFKTQQEEAKNENQEPRDENGGSSYSCEHGLDEEVSQLKNRLQLCAEQNKAHRILLRRQSVHIEKLRNSLVLGSIFLLLVGCLFVIQF